MVIRSNLQYILMLLRNKPSKWESKNILCSIDQSDWLRLRLVTCLFPNASYWKVDW